MGVATRVSIVEWINEKITPEICKKYCNKKHKLKANEAFMIAFITDILSGFQLGIPSFGRYLFKWPKTVVKRIVQFFCSHYKRGSFMPCNHCKQ